MFYEAQEMFLGIGHVWAGVCVCVCVPDKTSSLLKLFVSKSSSEMAVAEIYSNQ